MTLRTLWNTGLSSAIRILTIEPLCPWLATGRSVPLHDNLWPLPLVAFVISPWPTILWLSFDLPGYPAKLSLKYSRYPFPPRHIPARIGLDSISGIFRSEERRVG